MRVKSTIMSPCRGKFPHFSLLLIIFVSQTNCELKMFERTRRTKITEQKQFLNTAYVCVCVCAAKINIYQNYKETVRAECVRTRGTARGCPPTRIERHLHDAFSSGRRCASISWNFLTTFWRFNKLAVIERRLRDQHRTEPSSKRFFCLYTLVITTTCLSNHFVCENEDVVIIARRPLACHKNELYPRVLKTEFL